MAVIKVGCPKCGQRVSGDESFYGTSVECPVCTSAIRFPDAPVGAPRVATPPETPPSPPRAESADPRHETSAIPLPPKPRPAASPAPESVAHPSPVLGVVSMVLGIVSVMLFCLPGFLFGPAAIICGHLARSRGRHSGVTSPPGHGAALTGLLLGYLSLVGFILIILFLQPLAEWAKSVIGGEGAGD